MYADISTLWYLQWRQFVNQLRALVRNPGRAVLWVFIALYLAGLGYFKFRTRHLYHVPGTIPAPYGAAAIFGLVCLTAVFCSAAASGTVGAFSGEADARFLAMSKIAEPLIVLWLQVRRFATTLVRYGLLILFYGLLFGNQIAYRGIGLAAVAAVLVIAGLAIPTLKLANRVGVKIVASAFNGIAVLFGAAAAVTALGPQTPQIAPLAAVLQRTGAARAFDAIYHANPIALGILFALAACSFAVGWIAGRDLYPELYASSVKAIQFRRRQSRYGGLTRQTETYTALAVSDARSAFDRFGGPWTICWKEWLAFSRSPGAKRNAAIWLALSIAAGIVVGRLGANAHDKAAFSAGIGAGLLNVVIVMIAFFSAIGLAGDLRKPLWWSGNATVFMKLFAWLVGSSWQIALNFTAAMVAWMVAIGDARYAALAPLAMIPCALYLRAIGLALYGLFPSSIDQRGPLAAFRALLTYIGAAPPIACGIVAGLLLHSPIAGAAALIAAAIVEMLLLVWFASTMVLGRGAAFAQAEAA